MNRDMTELNEHDFYVGIGWAKIVFRQSGQSLHVAYRALTIEGRFIFWSSRWASYETWVLPESFEVRLMPGAFIP